MPATIKIKNSSTASAVPTSSDLVQGELAVNVTDRRIFTENASGTVVELGTNPTILTMGAAGSASAPVITRTGDTNTGIFFPAADTIAFAEGGTEAMRLDSSGNMGLGVTPSAWSSAFRSLDMFGTGSVASGSDNMNITNNGFFNGTNYIYKATGAANRYAQSSGIHYWFNAPSGTAGNAITFTQAMTLDASGNLLVGSTTNTSGLRILASDGTVSTGFLPASTIAYTGTWTNHAFGFATNGLERARIDSSGNLLVGTTSNPGVGKIGIQFNQSTNQAIALQNTSASNSGNYINFYNSSGTLQGYIGQTNSTTTAYVTSSDYRLKENVQPMTGALAKVTQLKPCTYIWKDNGFEGEGFIAHELAEVCPHAVMGEKDAVDEDGNAKYQGIDTSFLVATLTAAIQELKAEFDAYKASHP
jgi:hypothetical protein